MAGHDPDPATHVAASARRAVLSVPGSEPQKVDKALHLAVDEVVVDLEDAVPPLKKDDARRVVSNLRPRASGALAVRVNARHTRWFDADLEACATNTAVQSVVVPKVESAVDVRVVVESLGVARPRGRSDIAIQALIESALGLTNVDEIASALPPGSALIIGYADLAASLGRRPSASWQFAQDAVLLSARTHGHQAIDGPALTVDVGDELLRAAHHAESLGFDGKWVIHPRQVESVTEVFSPSKDEVTDAMAVIAAMDAAVAEGRGAVEFQGRMLDEAVILSARRVLSRSGNTGTPLSDSAVRMSSTGPNARGTRDEKSTDPG